MQIRKANSNDIKAIVEVWEEFLGEHDGVMAKRNPLLKEMDLRKGNAASLYKKFLASNLESGNGVVFVAEEGSQITGYSLGIVKDEIPIFQVERYGYISDLYVKKEFRGRGVSSKLKDSMMEWFKSKGVKYASVGFYSENHEAHEIYKKWGFFDYKIEARMKI